MGAVATAQATPPRARAIIHRDAHVARIAATSDDTLEVRLDGITLRGGWLILEIDDRLRYAPTSTSSLGLGSQARVTTAIFERDDLPWDGQLHAFVVQVDDQPFGPFFVALPERDEASRWWLLGGLAVVAVSAGLLLDRRRRAAAG